MDSGPQLSRRKVSSRLDRSSTLIEALQEEDRLLRLLLGHFPPALRETALDAEGMSFKDTLGHLAFWDDFTVHFFLSKLDPVSCAVPPPSDFEEASRRARETMGALPFGEVLARYLEATGAMLAFLKERWGQMSEKEQSDFWIPLKHRRQHRLGLEETLERMLAGEGDGPERAISATG